LYSIERVRHLVSKAEYAHLIASWVEYLGEKQAEAASPEIVEEGKTDYTDFYQYLAHGKEKQALSFLGRMTSSPEGRQQAGRYLIRGICDLYQGDYDPHFLTGLGASLWVMEQYREQPLIVLNALSQYLNYYLGR
jgi:hypothetical protein